MMLNPRPLNILRSYDSLELCISSLWNELFLEEWAYEFDLPILISGYISMLLFAFLSSFCFSGLILESCLGS